MASLRWLERQKGLCTYVVSSHAPLVIEDMQASDEWREQYFCAEHGVRFYAGVPLVTSHGHALGTLCLADGNPRQLSAVELERLQLFSRRVSAELQLSGAMKRTRSLEAELEATARYATVLAELSMQLDEGVESGQDSVVQAALEVLQGTAGLTWSAAVVEQDGVAWIACAAGELPSGLRGMSGSADDALRDLLAGGARAFDSQDPDAVAVIPLGTLAAVSPAMLVAGRDPGRRDWSPQDQRFLETGARLLGAALRRLQRWRDLHAIALTDELTGLRNRRALERLADDPAELGAVYRVWVGDLHGFKALNDSLGHAVGDLCLRQVADILLSQLRPADARFLFRLGGDEFALVLPLPEGGAWPDLTHRLQDAVGRLAEAAYPKVDLHLDLGQAEVPGETASLQEALRLADERMYAAKRGRRAER
jgi:diguanylate cyclase (GGDEF)-like protein